MGSQDAYVAELKIYQANLKAKVVRDGQLREFLKGRYYYLCRVLPEGAKGIRLEDYDPVDEASLNGLITGKGGSTPHDDYFEIRARMGLSPH